MKLAFSWGLLAWMAFGTAFGTAHAEVRLPHVLSDHMVLQRDAPIHIWGWADAGEAVHVTLGNETAQATADELGKWSVYLKPRAAGGPFDLQVQGGGAPISLTDIMLGDLWVASGQSNMEMPLAGFGAATPVNDGLKEIAGSNHPNLRLLRLPHVGSEFPRNDADATWTRCTPETAKDFSAVAYFFGREIAEKEHVAIGLIDSTWGGTPADAWTSLNAFGSNAALAPAWNTWERFLAEQANLPAIVAAEKREDEQRKQAGLQPLTHPWHPQTESYRPATLYNGMIAPLTPLTIRGVIWYQGETNSKLDRAPVYRELFSSMIADWRMHFAQGAFPFLFAQISSFRSTPQEAWGVLRDAQRRTLAVANTAMAVTLDVGTPDNVHPPDKLTVGHRMALAARALSYGEPVHYAGPLFARADVEGESIRVGFEDRVIKVSCRRTQCVGFEIAGADHRFVGAEATVDGSSVIVHSATVKKPLFVRYAWTNATDANLFDAEGLPASTFTSETDITEYAPRGTALTHD